MLKLTVHLARQAPFDWNSCSEKRII